MEHPAEWLQCVVTCPQGGNLSPPVWHACTETSPSVLSLCGRVETSFAPPLACVHTLQFSILKIANVSPTRGSVAAGVATHERMSTHSYGNVLAFCTIHDFVLHACTAMYYQPQLISWNAHNLTLISVLRELFISVPLAHSYLHSLFLCKVMQRKYWRLSCFFCLLPSE